MAASLVHVYVRPEAAYVTHSDRTTVGLWMEAEHWERVALEPSDALGAIVSRHLHVAPNVLDHPARGEFAARRAAVIAPLLRLAEERSWTGFLRSASLVSVEGGAPVRVTPMQRDGSRTDAFVPVTVASVLLDGADDETLGRTVMQSGRRVATRESDRWHRSQ